MSRNFELMQQAAATATESTVGSFTELLMPEKRKAKKGKPTVHRKDIGVDQAARAEAVRLVQKVFRTRGQEHRTVVFAAISSGSGCSWICVRTADILARSLSGDASPLAATFRTPSLPEALGASAAHG